MRERRVAGNEIVNVGVVGAGAMGTSHIDMLARWIADARVVAVYDADIARAKDVAAGVGAEVADSADQLITSADVDAVAIVAPDPLHEELALACLNAVKPTLCEKPLATTLDGSLRIVEAEQAGGRRLIQVGFMRRFDPAFVQLRHVVRTGDVGPIRAAHCVHRNAQAHPTATSEGVIVNSMIHELDSVPWVLDDPLAAITVTASRREPGELLDPQIAMLETVGGVVVTAEVFVNARYGYDVQCEVVGDDGTARLTSPYGLSFRQHGGDGIRVSADFVERFAAAYRIELDHWIRSVRDGLAVGPSAWDGYLANVAAFAGVESLRSGERVVIERPETPNFYR